MNLFIILYLMIISNSLKIRTKFCSNCKYFIMNDDTSYGKCSMFPNEDPTFLMDGIVSSDDYNDCSTAKSYSYLCGKNGTKYKGKYKIKSKK